MEVRLKRKYKSLNFRTQNDETEVQRRERERTKKKKKNREEKNLSRWKLGKSVKTREKRERGKEETMKE